MIVNYFLGFISRFFSGIYSGLSDIYPGFSSVFIVSFFRPVNNDKKEEFYIKGFSRFDCF